MRRVLPFLRRRDVRVFRPEAADAHLAAFRWTTGDALAGVVVAARGVEAGEGMMVETLYEEGHLDECLRECRGDAELWALQAGESTRPEVVEATVVVDGVETRRAGVVYGKAGCGPLWLGEEGICLAWVGDLARWSRLTSVSARALVESAADGAG